MIPDRPHDPRPQARHAGGCVQPVLLRGGVDHIDGTTGELLHRYTTVHEAGGVLPVACKTRRASRCLPCAEVYRADTYQLIRAGLTGGKGILATVASHPCVFTTLTAPSFGPVHACRERNGRVVACRPRRGGRTCPHGRPISCTERHTASDPRLGEPLCPDCYDYTGAVLFNAHAPELWRRFTITLRRAIARQAGMTSATFAKQARVSFAKVAEYQRRGLVHFHAVIRLDGPGDPATPPPTWTTLDILPPPSTRLRAPSTSRPPPLATSPHGRSPGDANFIPAPSPLPANSTTARSPLTSPNTPPKPPNAPEPSTSASTRQPASPTCPSASIRAT